MIERTRSIRGMDWILFGSDYIDYMNFTFEAMLKIPLHH